MHSGFCAISIKRSDKKIRNVGKCFLKKLFRPLQHIFFALMFLSIYQGKNYVHFNNLVVPYILCQFQENGPRGTFFPKSKVDRDLKCRADEV